jgi:flavin-binding protein dodecin
MSKAYKLIEVVGTSPKSYEDAIRSAVTEAQKSLKDLMWFEVTGWRGAIKDSEIEFQATVKMGFRLRD